MTANTNRVYSHPAPDAAWLVMRTGEATEPALPIVDPHHHSWDRPEDRYFLAKLLGHTIKALLFHDVAAKFYRLAI